MKSFKENMSLLFKGYKEVYSLEPKMLYLSLIQGVFEAIVPFVSLFFTSWILNLLLIDPTFETLMPVISLSLGVTFLSKLLAGGLEHYRVALISQTMDRKEMRLNNKVIYMDYEFIEKSEIHELRNYLAMAELTGGQGVYPFIAETKDLISQLTSVLISFGFVLPLFFAEIPENSSLAFLNSGWFLILTLIGGVLYFLYASRLYKRGMAAFNRMIAEGEKSNNLYGFIMTQLMDYQSGKELRLYKQQSLYAKVFQQMLDMTKQALDELRKEENKSTIHIQILIHFILGIGFIFSALKAMGGAILPGSVVIYTGAITHFIMSFPELISNFSRLYNNNQVLQKYFDFLQLKSDKHEGTLPVEKRMDNEYELEVRNVSFKYPGTDTYVLKNINLKMKIGKKLAIVGMNGSGKTTFIKLLTRLYDPTEGQILLNGIDIRKYNYDEYLRLFSVVFQDFGLFSFSLGQNVAASTEYEEQEVVGALQDAGFRKRYNKLPQGLNTHLYQNFDKDGVEISGGEAQKIAMARAIYKDAPIVILDEPTASLDPIAEFEIYSHFDWIVGSKTALYISHRLSSCRFCDEIAVFEDGEIVQLGSHDKLIKDANGKYHELWHAQAQYYTADEEGEIQEVVLT